MFRKIKLSRTKFSKFKKDTKFDTFNKILNRFQKRQLSHGKLIEVYKKTNRIDDDSADGGICHGVASASIPTILLEDMAPLRSRFNTLDFYDIEEFQEVLTKLEDNRLQHLNKKRHEVIKYFLEKNNKLSLDDLTKTEKILFDKMFQEEMNQSLSQYEKQLSQKEIDVLTIPAYLQTVKIQQDLPDFAELFEKNERPFSQNTLLGFSRTLPTMLMQHVKMILNEKEETKEVPNIERAALFSGVYYQVPACHEVEQYFFLLQEAFKDLNEPVAFLIGSIRHSIAVGWVPSEGWVIIDANQLPLLELKNISHDQIAHYVFKSLKSETKITFATEIFIKATASSQLKQSIQSLLSSKPWLDLHSVKYKAQAVDDLGGSWLYCAARTNDTQILKPLIEENCNVNVALPSSKMTPLIIAACHGHTEAVRLLLTKDNIDVDQASSCGYTALMEASLNGIEEIVGLLIKANANINSVTKRGTTPLQLAAKRGHCDILRLLIENNANVNYSYEDGATPLFMAVFCNHVDAVKLLIAAGADVNLCTQSDEATPLMIAIENNNLEIVKLLLNSDNIDVTATTTDGESPLMFAIKNGNNDIIHLLLEAHVKRNINALDWAMTTKNLEIITLLTDYMDLHNLVNAVNKLLQEFNSQHSLMSRLKEVTDHALSSYQKELNSDALQILINALNEIKSEEAAKNISMNKSFFDTHNPLSLSEGLENILEKLTPKTDDCMSKPFAPTF